MGVTYGFYDSSNHDRVYSAKEFGRLFEGIINDGVFMNLGHNLIVVTNGGMSVKVQSGRCWFNNTWLNNDSDYPLILDSAEVAVSRIDAIIVEVDSTYSTRANSIKIVRGTPAAAPRKPILVNAGELHQYPLAYVTIPAGTNEITQANIENAVGTEECPFITGILETVNISNLLLQWDAEWDDWLLQQRLSTETWKTNFQDAYEIEFDDWFEHLQVSIDGDVATNLQNQIDDEVIKSFNRYYGFENKQTTISKDAYGNVSSILEVSSEATCTTTFSENMGSKIITTVVVPTEGVWQYVKTTTITYSNASTQISEQYTKGPKSS